MTRRLWIILALLLYATGLNASAIEADHPRTSSTRSFPQGVPMPLRVGVSLYIIDLKQLHESSRTYQGLIQLHYRWRDPALAFSTAATGLDSQVFADQEAIDKLASIWNPQVLVSNLQASNSSVGTGLIIRADGSVELMQRIKGSFETRLELAAFPFDRQNLQVVILSSRYSSNQVMLVQDAADLKTSGFDPQLKLTGWDVQDLSFSRAKIIAWNGLPAEQLTGNLQIKRLSAGILSTIFTPLLLLMLVPTIITFGSSFELGARLTAWAGSILALVALNFTLSLRFQGLDGANLISNVILTGHIYQLVSVLLVVTLYSSRFTLRLGHPFVVNELVSYLHWVTPVGFVGALLCQTLLTAYVW